MNQNSGEIIGNIIPLAIFIYLALIMRGVVKPKKNIPLLTNPSILARIIVYGGILIFVILLAIGLFGK
jgi:hypothetical protein